MAHARRGVGREGELVAIDAEALGHRLAQVGEVAVAAGGIGRLGEVLLLEGIEHDLRHRAAGADVHVDLLGLEHEHALNLCPEGFVLRQLRAQVRCLRRCIVRAGADQRPQRQRAGAIGQHPKKFAPLRCPRRQVFRLPLRRDCRSLRLLQLVHGALPFRSNDLGPTIGASAHCVFEYSTIRTFECMAPVRKKSTQTTVQASGRLSPTQ